MATFSLSGVRILHVHTLPVVSGSGINTFLTMKGSRECGARVALACAPGGRLERLVRSAEMDFYPVHNFVSELSPFRDFHALWQMNRLMAREKFDLVHTHNSKAGFLGRLAARRHGAPVIIHTVHGFAFHEAESWFFRHLFILLERAAARWCDKMIVISQPLLEWALKEQIAPRERLIKIYSGIEIERFHDHPADPALGENLGIQSAETVIGIVSKLWQGKGHEILLRAVANLLSRGHRIKLLIVGEGGLEQKLKRKVSDLGIEDSVIFTGFRQDMPEITALLDISVLPSFYEGMGRVVLEAMAAAKPVVATRVGGLIELVEDQVTGFLIPPGNVQALVEQLERLILDPDLRVHMGRKGREKVSWEHSAAAMVGKIHQVYAQCLTRRTGREVASAGARQNRDSAGSRFKAEIR